MWGSWEAQGPGEDAFLGVEAVFGAVEDDGLRAVDDFGGDFLPAVGGEAMHEDGVGGGLVHQALVDLVGGEEVVAADGRVVVHADPCVGDNATGASDGGSRVVGQFDAGALAAGPVEEFLGGAAEFGGGDAEGEAEADGGLDPGAGDVVAVAYPSDDLACDGAAMLLEGHDVGHELAGVAHVGEAVDDGDRGVGGEFVQAGHVVGPEHDGVDVAREDAGGVGDGFAAAELEFGGGEVDDLAA